MFDQQNGSMRHLMMFETFRHQQESMRHLNRVMAENHGRPMNVPHPSVYHAPAGSHINLCPLCKASLDQFPSMHMASCGFCGTIVSYEDNISDYKRINTAFPKLKTGKKISELSKFLILIAILMVAGMLFIFLPVENFLFFEGLNKSKIWSIVFSLLAGFLITIVLYIVLKSVKWTFATLKKAIKASRNRQYYF